jgi:alkylation response protein AidB-like acyl-CoA dehydrogenase
MGHGVLHLDNVEVPASNLLGDEGSALRSVLNGFDFTRPLLALAGIGCAQATLDETPRRAAPHAGNCRRARKGAFSGAMSAGPRKSAVERARRPALRM